MKFTDGNWLMQPDITPHYAQGVYDYEIGHDSLTIWCPDKQVRHRGDTLNAPLIRITYTSPQEGVIRVKMTHFEGGVTRGPHFDIKESQVIPVIEDTGETLVFRSGDLSVCIQKNGPLLVRYFSGARLLTWSARKHAGYMEQQNGCTWMHEGLGISVGENIYGLGERFTALVKNGQVVDSWNEDGGTASQQAYKCIPFFISNRGYGVLVNQPERVSFEVASEHVSRTQFSVAGESLEYMIFDGPTPADVLGRYTALTGRPALPPAWSFGLWLTTSFTTDYDEQTVMHFVEGMASRELPLSVFHFDCFWMREYHWCDFQWDTRVFPDPAGMLARMKARGLKICVWINPYIAQRSSLFAEGRDKGYFIRRVNGDVWQWDLWQAGMACVDFTNPEACAWYAGKLEALIDMGVDCFKTDFGERIPTDVVYHDGSDPLRMHNYYTQLYNKCVFDLLERRLGKDQAVLFARSATAGGQQFPVHWGGDCSATFESMAESLRGGLSLGLSGFGFWSHDIGGFESTASPSVYKRWLAFGLLSSHSRLHGNESYRVPWLFDEESVDVLRTFAQLKCTLMPYLYGQAVRTAATGVPMMQAMMLAFPGDPACDTLDRQYMLGDALLVAPVFSESEVTWYLPEGRWTHLLTGRELDGGRWIREHHSYFSLPVMVRPHTLLARGAEHMRTDYDYASGVTFCAYALDEGRAANAVVTDIHGRVAVRASLIQAGTQWMMTADGAEKPWSLLLVNVHGNFSADHGMCTDTPEGVRVVPEPGATKLNIQRMS